MQNLLRSFFFEQNEVRTIMVDGNPWFVAKDVCDVFGDAHYRRSITRLEECDKHVTHMYTPRGYQKMVTVNEFGLFELLFYMQPQKSKTPDRDVVEKRKALLTKFRRWVTHEVLPSIRKYGAYMTDDLLDAMVADDEVLSRIAAQLRLERTKTRFLETKLQADMPMVLFAKAVSASDSAILVGDLAKLIYQNGFDIGRNRLFAWMRANGFLMKQGASRNTPTQRAMEAGLFRLSESVSIQPYGRIHLTKTPQVTGKGQRYFIDTFCGSTAIH